MHAWFAAKNVFCKSQPAGGATAGQCEKGAISSLDLVGMCVQNVIEIASCVHDVRHFVQNGPLL